MTELSIGSEFAGHRIETEIGRGGMGIVYRATHLRLNRAVALKVVAPGVDADPGFRERFEREAAHAASIDSPNVIPVFHAGEEDGVLFVTMRYVEGTDLRAMLEKRGRLEPGLAAEIVSQTAAGLDAAHAEGLVHRDVKPANILVREQSGGPHAYVTDFGVATARVAGTGLTATGVVLGTIDYMAPEQCEGSAVDARTDVYALGGVLHHALTGEVPYPRESEVAKLYAHGQAPPPSPSELVPDLPAGFDETVKRAMAKEPGDRFGTAGAMGRSALSAAQAITAPLEDAGAATPDVTSKPTAGRTSRVTALDDSPMAPRSDRETREGRLPAPADGRRVGLAAHAGPLRRAGEKVLRSRIATAHPRWFARDHVVVAGLGDKGFALARALKRDQRRVAVVEIEENSHVARCRRLGIPTVIGDATDPAVLAQAGLRRARSLIGLLGDDGMNLHVAFTARDVVPPHRDRLLASFVHLSDLAFWRLVTARGIASAQESRQRVAFFNVDAMAARLLLERHPAFEVPYDAADPPQIGVIGMDWLGESVIVGAAREWRNSRASAHDLLRVSVIDKDADAACRRLAERYRGLSSVCALEAYNVDQDWTDASSWVRHLPGLAAHSRFFVCLADEKAGLAASFALLDALDAAAPVVFVVRDEGAGVAAMLSELRVPRLHRFGVLGSTLSPGVLERGITEDLAKAAHDHYRAAGLARGETPATNPSLVEWSRLPDSLKESNRSFADGIGEKLDQEGYSVVPAPLSDQASPGQVFSEQQIERLAPLEHERWMRDLQSQGWRRSETGEKDPHRLRHPNLVPWDQLSPEDQEKDRDAVRVISAILARAGFELVRTSDGVLSPGLPDHPRARQARVAETS